MSFTHTLPLSRIPSHTLFQRSCVPFFPLLFCLPFQIAGLSAEGLANCDSSFAVELGPLVDTKYRYGRERLAHVAVRCCTEKKKKKLRKKLRNNTTLHCPWMRPLNGPHFKARFSTCGLSFLPFFFFFSRNPLTTWMFFCSLLSLNYIYTCNSDSANLDSVFELYAHAGKSAAEALMLMVPQVHTVEWLRMYEIRVR